MRPSNEVLEAIGPSGEPDLFYEKATEPPRRRWTARGAFAAAAAAAALALVPLRFSVTGVARVQAANDIMVEALVDGELASIDVKEGQWVRKGDRIGRLADRANDLALVQARDELTVTGKELVLLKDRAAFLRETAEVNAVLLAKNAVTAREKESSEYEHRQAVRQVDILETRLETLRSRIRYLEELRAAGEVRAPMDGVVLTKLSHRLSTFFRKGDEILKIADLRHMVLEMPIPENQLPRVREGSPARLRFFAYPGRVFRGRVLGIHHSAYETVEKAWVKENVINVLIHVDEELPFRARGGMTAKASIRSDGESLYTRIRNALLF